MDIKVVLDRNIPYLESLDKVFHTCRLSPEEINADTMRDADALITRTRTRCDATLLDGSRCRFIGTATIGTDHIDFDYCRRHGITAVSAPGCNAPAVAQYVLSSILHIADRPVESYTIGIVGAGHVGSIVERWARHLGMQVLVCDPPRQDAEGDTGFVSLEEIASQSDIITFHTPYTRHGAYPTHHLADTRFFESLRHCDILINSARGPVTDTAALIAAIDRGSVRHAVIDCWEGEPYISAELLAKATIATPHIAGYSAEGKKRASAMIARQLCDHFGINVPPGNDIPAGSPDSVTAAMIADSYDPLADTAMLRDGSDRFEQLRNHYRLRHGVGFI